MAQPIKWHGVNKELTAAKGTEAFVQPLPVFSNGAVCVSCWQLSAEELEEIGRTGKIFISIYHGGSQPPVYLGMENDVRNQVADFGSVWKRET